MIKLALLDVDGTITDTKRMISTRAVEEIRKAQDNGVLVSLVSGNVVPVMYGLRIFIGLKAPVFAENGGAMFQDDIRTFFQIDGPRKVFQRMESEGMAEGIISNQWRLTSVGYVPKPGFENYISGLARENGLATVDSGYSWHLLNKGQDKGFALEKLRSQYDLDYDEILVMGDSFNDASMFMEKVYKAAPNNAEEKIKEMADYVCTSTNGDGVAEVLSRISGL